MSKVRIYGDTSGYVDIAVPAVAGTTTLNLDKIPQADISGNIAMDTDTLYVDAANNRVGIGNTSPTYKFEVSGTGDTVQYIANANPSGSQGRTLLIRDNYASASQDSKISFAATSSPGNDVYLGKRTTSNAGYFHLTNSGGTEHMTVNMTTGNVGIGTSSPNSSADLHVADTSDARIWVDATSGDTLELYAGTGVGVYNRSNSHLIFGTNNSERMRIDSSGNLLVGKTSTNSDTVGVEILPAGQVYVTANNTLPFYINRKGTSGNNEFARFSDDGATRGTIASSYLNELTISASGTNSSGILFSQSNQVRPMKNGSTSSGTIDLGAGNGQWKDLYLSGGAYIGGTGSANYLDDYERGNFDPVLSWATPSNGSVSYIARTAEYIKVGRAVTIHLEMRLNVVSQNSASLPLLVGGFPFNFRNTGGYGGSLMQVSLQGFTFSSGHIPYGWGLYNSDKMYLFTMSSNALNSNLATPGNYKTINVSGTYITTA